MGIQTKQIENEPRLLGAYTTPPTTGAGVGSFGAKEVLGVTEAFFVDSSGNEVQLTNGGVIATPAGSGEANTASNLGTSPDGEAIFSGKSGVDLQFRRIKAGTGIALSTSTNFIEIVNTGGAGGGEVNTASNIGAGEGIFAQKSGLDLEFKSLIAGSNISLVSGIDGITISSSGGGSGEANTASNLGAGLQVFSQKSGVDLQFRTITAGSNISLVQTADTIEISSTGGGATVNEIKFTLPAGADLATRVASVSGLPTGYTVNTAAAAGDSQLGSDAEDLVIGFPGALSGSIAQDIRVYQVTNSGPATVQGVAQISPSTITDIKTNTAGTAARVTLVGKGVNTARDLVVYMKLI